MQRRTILRGAVAAGILGPRGAAVGSSGTWSASSANRELAQHRIARFESVEIVDRFPRPMGPNAKSWGGGRGAVTKARILTTDKGIRGWSLGGGHRVDPAPWIGRRVGDLFDASEGIAAGVPAWLDKTLHDLAAGILDMPV